MRVIYSLFRILLLACKVRLNVCSRNVYICYSQALHQIPPVSPPFDWFLDSDGSSQPGISFASHFVSNSIAAFRWRVSTSSRGRVFFVNDSK